MRYVILSFYKGKDVAVLGDGNYAIHEFETLKPIASSVTILTNGNTMVENRDSSIEVNSKKKIREFRGDTKLEKVEFEDNTIQNLNGVFIAMGTASSSDLARKIGARIENNNIVVNEKYGNYSAKFICMWRLHRWITTNIKSCI